MVVVCDNSTYQENVVMADGIDLVSVRNLLDQDADTGATEIQCRVAPGMKFAFQYRDPDASRSDLVERLVALRARLDGRRPAFGLYFDCQGRGASLYGSPGVDVAIIREILGDFPLAGFLGLGEIGPFADRPVVQRYTGVLALFLESGKLSLSPSPPYI